MAEELETKALAAQIVQTVDGKISDVKKEAFAEMEVLKSELKTAGSEMEMKFQTKFDELEKKQLQVIEKKEMTIVDQLMVNKSQLDSVANGSSSKLDLTLKVAANPILPATLFNGATGSSIAIGLLGRTNNYPVYRPHMRDVVPTGGTQAGAVPFLSWSAENNGAAGVLPGDKKPDSDLVFNPNDGVVRVIAHIMTIDRSLLLDVQGLANTLNVAGTEFLLRAEDTMMINGNGTAPNYKGLLAFATTPSFAGSGFGTVPTNIDVLIAAATKVKTAGGMPSAHILNPTDAAKLKYYKDSNGLYNQPFLITYVNGIYYLDGVPIVEIPSMPVGTFLTGDFPMATQLFVREDVNVRISEENKDNFEKNLITLRVELREVLAVYWPQLLITSTFAAAKAQGSGN